VGRIAAGAAQTGIEDHGGNANPEEDNRRSGHT
jgi:hypothetical protein